METGFEIKKLKIEMLWVKSSESLSATLGMKKRKTSGL
jgi:hypothetical protein